MSLIFFSGIQSLLKSIRILDSRRCIANLMSTSENYDVNGHPINLVFGGEDFGFNLNHMAVPDNYLSNRLLLSQEMFQGNVLELMSRAYPSHGSIELNGRGFVRISNLHLLYQKFESW